MKNNNKSGKWRRYLNILLGISNSKPKRAYYAAADSEPSSVSSFSIASDYRMPSGDHHLPFTSMDDKEVFTANGAQRTPDIQFCSMA